MPNLTAQQLTEFCISLLKAAGVSEAESVMIADSLVDTNLLGHDSHGVVRLPWYLKQLREGELVAGAPLIVERETPAALVCNASLGFGQVQATRLTKMAMEKAHVMGIACATARNCGHVGRLGAYPEMAAAENLAAMMTVNDNGTFRVVAPPGGIEARVSTNPISIAVPSDDGPLVYDASTSVVAQGKVLVHRVEGTPCPEGWLQDAEGQPTTDPNVLVTDPRGTILPLGGDSSYKGFGLSMMLDMLVGGLSGGYCPPAVPGAANCNAVLLVVWDPTLFSGFDHFTGEVKRLTESIRTCPRREGVDQISLPGERGVACREQRMQGGIPIPEGNWSKLVEAARELDVTPPDLG